MSKRDLIIIGAGGHAGVVVDTAQESGYNVLGIIDTDYKDQKEDILGVEILGGRDYLDNLDANSTLIFVAIGNNHVRREEYLNLTKMGFSSPTLVHPSAMVSRHVEIAAGTLINSGVVINAGTCIGECCIINTGAVLDHEVNIGDYTHIAPGVKIGGRSGIGTGAFIGLGTSIIDFISIGDNAMIGAGSTIVKDVNADAKVVGIGRIIGK
ncbi:MAG: acetyltransferase [Flavobacteriales bacterium]|nr:acetyltransferase [Flavobacteriales bacterium]